MEPISVGLYLAKKLTPAFVGRVGSAINNRSTFYVEFEGANRVLYGGFCVIKGTIQTRNTRAFGKTSSAQALVMAQVVTGCLPPYLDVNVVESSNGTTGTRRFADFEYKQPGHEFWILGMG